MLNRMLFNSRQKKTSPQKKEKKKKKETVITVRKMWMGGEGRRVKVHFSVNSIDFVQFFLFSHSCCTCVPCSPLAGLFL